MEIGLSSYLRANTLEPPDAEMTPVIYHRDRPTNQNANRFDCRCGAPDLHYRIRRIRQHQPAEQRGCASTPN